jgi:UDP-glucose 4-epimerase
LRTLVVGGSGFVGSHVADALSDAGHEVSILDAAESPWRRSEQRFSAGDVTDPDAVAAAVQGQDAVYNFAGIADIDEARRRPVDTVRVNIGGNVQVLEACAAAGVGRYLFASSIYVFSETGSFYRVSKQAAELYVEEYQREHGLDYTILRYGTLYGPRADARNSVQRYLRQALSERRVQAAGTGDELREYIHVEDAARLSVDVLAPEFANEQVVLTGQQAMRYRDLLELIREIVGEDVSIELSEPTGEGVHYAITPYHFRPRKARKLVANHYVDLGQGLLDCLHEIHAEEASARP